MKKKLNYLLFLPLFIFTILTSCKTVKPGFADPFGIIGEDAELYLYLPLEGNRDFVNEILGSMTEEKSIKTALAKTKTIYAGFFASKQSPELRVCTRGSYPYTLTDVIFRKQDGWEKHTSPNKYNYYEGGYIDVSIPAVQLACLSLGPSSRQNMDDFLAKLDSPSSPVFSPKFKLMLENTTMNSIGLYATKPNFLLAQMMGVNLELPIKALEIYFNKDSKNPENYKYAFNLETENPTSAYALNLLLRRVLDADISKEGNTLIIENGNISAKRLAGIVRSMYTR